jgi:hypothetical protein
VAPLVLVLTLSGMLVGCGSPAASDARARRSWDATAQLLLAEWRRGHVPDRYTADTLRVAAAALDDRRPARAADAVERGDHDVRLAPP